MPMLYFVDDSILASRALQLTVGFTSSGSASTSSAVREIALPTRSSVQSSNSHVDSSLN
jgi:hypothetical protein